jgi:hypothetical protein
LRVTYATTTVGLQKVICETGATGENTGRRLRELTEEGLSHAHWVSGDETRRKALSGMLDADFVPQNRFDYSSRERQPETLSWPEIYFEIGKLSAAVTFYDLEGNVSSLEVLTQEMKQNWDKHFAETRPKLT